MPQHSHYRRWLAALLASSMCLNACDLIYPYEPPVVQTPEAFVEQPGALVQQGWPVQDWWQAFQSDELSALQAQAAAHNFDIAAAEARVRQADAQLRISGASLFPVITANGGGSYTHNRASNVTTSSAISGRSGESYSANLQASYEVDFWGKNRSAVDAAEASRDAQQYDRQVVALSINGSVATVYFDLLTTRERLAVAQENVASSNQTLVALQKRFEAGIISRLEVAQQQTVVAELAATIPPLQLKLSQDRDALAVLVGQLPEALAVPQGKKLEEIALPVVPAGLPSALLARRPDVAVAEANLIAAHANINVARAAFFPSINLTASGGYQSTALNSLFSPGGQLASFGLDLVQPIFQGGLLTGQLELAKAQYEELAQTYYKSVVSAFADTEDALAAVQRADEQANAQTEVLRSARDSYALSQRQFTGGIVDITSVLTTQRALFTAQDNYLQVRQQQLNAIVSLYQALGGGVHADATVASES